MSQLSLAITANWFTTLYHILAMMKAAFRGEQSDDRRQNKRVTEQKTEQEETLDSQSPCLWGEPLS